MEYRELEQCVERARQGDGAALADLCARFAPLVKKAAGRARPRDYDEALAEGYLAFLEAVWSYRAGEGGRFAGYAAMRVKYGLFNNYKREQRRRRHETPPYPAADGGGPFDGLTAADDVAGRTETKLLAAQAGRMIERLPARQRQAVRLTLLEGAPPAAAARRLGISAQAVCNLRRRAIERLRRLMGIAGPARR